MQSIRILVVCAGNICRSPLGEGLLRHRASLICPDLNLDIDSAGTGAWHIGEGPNPNSVRIAADNGIDISAQRARQVVREDFDRFDLILAMDRANMRDLARIAPGEGRAELHLFMEYGTGRPDPVPDPYERGWQAYETAYAMLLEGSDAVLDRLGKDFSASGKTSSVR